MSTVTVMRISGGKRKDVTARVLKKVARGKCYYIGLPLVMKNCNCYADEEHRCQLGFRAVPSGSCQTCTSFVPD